MPSWLSLLMVLLAITLVALLLLWFLGLLGNPFGASGRQRPGPASVTPPEHDAAGRTTTVPRPGPAARSATPPRSSRGVPPPAMAGPRPDWDTSPAPRDAPAPSDGDSEDGDSGPPRPAAAPKRTSKPPPAQAAWSGPADGKRPKSR